ncbi:MAG: hypothetical protein L0G94_18145 [Brachybacterium sp.]|uniref:hypothetical protein n=1 Tax=Brachybacterium sp. TaxID=1891286 RepID=UPI00264A17C6|nr:hypothetical protein [Brachybacterium sp.]MDN5688578.1 hypothetical protein [Brachybacterium sp.]
MSDRSARLDTDPVLDDPVEDAVEPSDGSIEGRSGGPVGDRAEETVAFGEREPTRFAADVEYRGRAQGHDYLVRVRHRFLDSTFTVVLDGVEHDPKAEEKATRKAGAESDAETEEAQPAESAAIEERADGTRVDSAVADGERADGPAGDGDRADGAAADRDSIDSAAADDGLRFRLEESITVVHCTVRRPDAEGDIADAEVLSVRTAGLGGAGEVDVRHGLERTLLVPADDSPSAARDRKRTAHPTRYALIAALTRAAGFLLPLLGLGALFSGLLDPVKEWVGAQVRPIIEAIAEFFDPVRDWIARVLRPIREFLDALFDPVREFLSALFAPVQEVLAAIWRPMARAWNWLTDLLFGWIPDLSLPFEIPEWVVDVAVPVLVVLVVFAVTFSSLRHRHEKLEATRQATDPAPGSGDGEREADAEKRTSADEERASGTSADSQGAGGPPGSSPAPRESTSA